MKTRRFATFAAAVAMAFPFVTAAATLGEIAGALAAPANAPQATSDWLGFAKLKGTKWQGNAPKRGGNQYYWNAKLPLDGAGAGELSLVGSQKLVTSATVGWPKDIQLAKVSQFLAGQFPKDAKLEQVRGACPGETLSGSRIYRATLAGRKPLFLHVQYAASDRGGSTSTIEMEPQRNKLWIC